MWAYVFTPLRSDGLALGALVAVAMHHERDVLLAWLGRLLWPLSALLAVLVGIDFVGFYAGPMAVMHLLVPLWSSIVVIAVVSGEAPGLDRWLSLRPLVFVGKVSYALYLLHPAVYIVTSLIWRAAALPALETSLPSAIAHACVVSLASVGVATLTWRTLEEPMIGLKDRFAPSDR